jgi:Transport and Golgi organisation 2
VNVCTVSTIPFGDGLRLVCNRDEQRTRPVALEPRSGTLGMRMAIFPVDPVSGGTWIGINDACLAFVLLNRTPHARSRVVVEGRQSRGTIIPPLLAHERLHNAIDQAMTIEPSDFEPFRLIALQGFTLASILSDGRRLSCTFMNPQRPLLFTSSSLGDARVEIPRHDLFDRMVVDARCGWRDGQSRFHRHQWRRRPEISIVMSRADARTVSRTVIDATTHVMRMRYQPLGESSTPRFRASVAQVVDRRLACAA